MIFLIFPPLVMTAILSHTTAPESVLLRAVCGERDDKLNPIEREKRQETLALTVSYTNQKNFFVFYPVLINPRHATNFSVNGASNFQKQARSSLYSKDNCLVCVIQRKINTYYLKEAVGLRLCIFANDRIIFFFISMMKSMVNNRRSHDLQ